MINELISIREIVNRTSRRLCLLCNTNLDEDIGTCEEEGHGKQWHIPLCRKHRAIAFDEMMGRQ